MFNPRCLPKELPYLVCYFREASLPCHLLDYTDHDNLSCYTFPTYWIIYPASVADPCKFGTDPGIHTSD
jgi:hypothetical protein